MNKSLKSILISILSVSFAMSSFAEVMEWTLKPGYKDIVPMGGSLYKVQADDGKWGVFNAADGIITIEARYDSITSLVEDRALILGSDGQVLYGIIDEKGGEVAPLTAPEATVKYVIHKEYPYFSDGMLPVGEIQEKRGRRFGYVDKEGKEIVGFNYCYASPFTNGLAMVWNGETSYRIIDKEGTSQILSNEPITFISNPDADGAFLYCTKKNKVKIAKLQEHSIRDIKNLNDKGHIVEIEDIKKATSKRSIGCRGGNTLRFDNAMRFIADNSETQYAPVIAESKTKLNYQKKDNGLYNIIYDSNELLKEQFQTVRVYNDNYAVVTMKDGYKGILKYNPNGKFTISYPKDTAFVFYHNTPAKVPVDVRCEGFNVAPKVELSCDGSNRTLDDGNGQVEFDFYEAHDTYEQSTDTVLYVGVMVGGLDYGTKSIKVSSSHTKNGYKCSLCKFSEYSDNNNEGTVQVSIESLNGTPHSSAFAKINGKKVRFNGLSASYTITVNDVPVRGSKKVTVIMKVQEDGCPIWKDSKSGKIDSHANKY